MENDIYFQQDFECLHKKCPKRHQKIRLHIWRSDYYKGNLPKCDSCGNKLALKIEEDKSGTVEIPAIGKFSSLSKKQKQESLKKRSKEHFNKYLKEDRKHKYDTNYGMGNNK